MFRFWSIPAGIALSMILLTIPAVHACPFCSAQGVTLAKELEQSSFVVHGKLINARLLNVQDGTGTTDLVIEAVIKPHEYLKDKKIITLPRYVPTGNQDDVRFIVFFDVFMGRLDPFRGIPVKDKVLVEYLQKIYALKDAKQPERLKLFFDYLEHPDPEITTDAYKEFGNSSLEEVQQWIRSADRSYVRKRLTEWLRSKDTPALRLGFYGFLLGLCGQSDDAVVLQGLLQQRDRDLVSGLDGILTGLTLLNSQEGLQAIKRIMSNEKEDFTRRYAALRAVRYLWDNSAPGVSRETLLACVVPLLSQGDIADLAIEDLRKWKRWEFAETVLALYHRPSHSVPIIQRAILRYALTCSEQAQGKAAQLARTFLEQRRKEDPKRVRDVEELLKIDEQLSKPGSGS
ncbi:MAG: hypothetical protein NZM42_07865 [Gemmatales bacterium]|nr:hypothetical protein [Gemmatales bacterium]MDW8222896.1 hypothetical protein [Gemmatales bacterium]